MNWKVKVKTKQKSESKNVKQWKQSEKRLIHTTRWSEKAPEPDHSPDLAFAISWAGKSEIFFCFKFLHISISPFIQQISMFLSSYLSIQLSGYHLYELVWMNIKNVCSILSTHFKNTRCIWHITEKDGILYGMIPLVFLHPSSIQPSSLLNTS